MPVYSYRCKNCGVQFDQRQNFSDPPLSRCPECSKNSLQKVFQPVGVVFKGSGFYSTDHRSPSGKGRFSKNDKSGDGEKEESKSEAKSEAKSESKSETKTNAPEE
jgi:putative FmdB family regulatory protein